MNVFQKFAVAVCVALVSVAGVGCDPCQGDADCVNGHACVEGTCEEITADAGADAGSGARSCVPGSLCRPAIGDCDVAETCDANGQCPADTVAGVGQVCRAPAGSCDVEERCTGTSPQCPADALEPATTVCRSPGGECDVEEKCDGTHPECPADQVQGTGFVCRLSAGACDVEEICDGNTAHCPTDVLEPNTTVCRPSAGACDPEERCEGDKAACPANVISTSAEICRPAVNVCDAQESCDGVSASCPPNQFQPMNTQCAAATCSGGQTTPARYCAGTSATCTPLTPISCNGYQCAGNTCGTSCSTHTDCMSTHYCQPDNQCAPRRVDGQPCSGAAFGYECASGVCAGSYVDNDSDGFGVGMQAWFCGTTPPPGRASVAGDCCDSDSRSRPGQTAFYTSASSCGGYDFNCNGVTTFEFPAANACNSTGSCSLGEMSCDGTTGWSAARPACGATATYVTSCTATLACTATCPGCENCSAITAQRTQGCN